MLLTRATTGAWAWLADSGQYGCSIPMCRRVHTTSQLLQEAVQTNEPQAYEFQAETRMLLDIVAKSLYSEKEVFVRELISNASDAIEKARYLALQGKELDSSEADMKIHITTDKYDKTLTIQDSGIGMSREELIDNLGTIARSGSKAFIQQLQEGGGADPQSIIGQFGVGFYSAFMVAEKVEVFTKSRLPGSIGYIWASDGCGKYTVEECQNVEPGTKIICHLKVENREFADEQTIKDVIKKYSSFIGSPIEVNGEQANNIKPIWLMDPKEVSPDQHDEFYRYVGSAYDKPRFVLHYRTDAPVDLRCVLYVPEGKPGLFDLNRDAESSVSLYCRRVLIMNKAENVLPKWLRFLKGVVDSEDIPLNLSRELLQDSALIRRLRTVIQNRVVRFLFDKSRKDAESYSKFFTDYGIFIKEGILSSQEQVEKEEIAKLIMYDSSAKPIGEKVTLPEYIGRMTDNQKDIYYLAAPSRELAESSPYFEALKKRNVEVLFCYEPYDEVVLMQLQEFGNRKIISVEKEMRQDKDAVDYEGAEGGLRRSQANELMDWLKTVLSGRCWGVKATPRLESHPCVITVEEMGAARHFVRTQFTQIPEETRYSLLQPQLEINPGHPIIMKLNELRESNPRLAELTAKQLFSNAMVLAGLVEDPRTVLSSMNELLQLALEKH
ncbi:heat shock protein 75 kDa, mitochondrial-like isoform X2 [Homarus americanus]|uniref:Heat shock protein 75 kDa, mitochondrial n=1 Tax=Homarus americanus TaxID=6706 RepID=A0A8J5JR25_HOMAM|nr:heat shock protein 75 kDa, mitochondrial-like isoform X2 [Homarus americanus]KAG7162571.1 Heat shock protein 75 kDa-like [Homarus americanus]